MEVIKNVTPIDKNGSSPPKRITSRITVPIKTVEDYKQYNHNIEAAYMGVGTYYSITLDLISLYLKGQKLLYTESKTFCEMLLYILMLPAIFISSACTVLNVPLKSVSYGATIVSALNGFNSFILAFVTYMKLDAKAEAHKTSAYQFDKLQAMCEFWSGKSQMIPDKDVALNVFEFIESIEKKVSEIKDANQFTIPEVIRYRYNHVYSYNVFAMMKNHKTERSLNIQKLINITDVIQKREISGCVENNTLCNDCNEIRIVLDNGIDSFPLSYQKKKSVSTFYNKEHIKEINIHDPKIPMETLYNERDNLITDIIEYRDMTIDLTEKYNSEMEVWINKKKSEWCAVFNWLKT